MIQPDGHNVIVDQDGNRIINARIKYGLFCVRDNRNGFLTPSPADNEAVAVRSFAHACMNTESVFFTHPEDYEFYLIGYFYPETGVIEPCDKKVLATALDFVRKGVD